jgi:hypothetical protein
MDEWAKSELNELSYRCSSKLLKVWIKHKNGERDCAGTFAEYSDFGLVATEYANVGLDPLQSGDLIFQAEVEVALGSSIVPLRKT